MWRAESTTKDFRQSKWVSTPIAPTGGQIEAEVTRAAASYQAFYLDFDYDVDGTTYHLCSQIQVVPPSNKSE